MIYWIAILWTLIATVQTYRELLDIEKDEKFREDVLDKNSHLPIWLMYSALFIFVFIDQFLRWWYYIWLFNVWIPIKVKIFLWTLQRLVKVKDADELRFYMRLLKLTKI